MVYYLFFLFLVVIMGVVLILLKNSRSKEGYENWDFMDLPNYCPKVKTIVDVPRFGGVPNQSQVWNIDGRCDCGKFFHG